MTNDWMSVDEKLNLMELELQYQDDNSSSSSSHSNPTSEGTDDLKLGAEADSFVPKQDKKDSNGMIKLVQKFLVLKRNKECNCSVSTISTISDLLDAREGDPEDLLVGLGFVPSEDDNSRTSILSRFRPVPTKSPKLPSPDQEKR